MSKRCSVQCVLPCHACKYHVVCAWLIEYYLSMIARVLSRGGWSHYYMHGAAPITQYMAASTEFNPLSQQIIIYVRAITIRIDVIRNVHSIITQYCDQPPLGSI